MHSVKSLLRQTLNLSLCRGNYWVSMGISMNVIEFFYLVTWRQNCSFEWRTLRSTRGSLSTSSHQHWRCRSSWVAFQYHPSSWHWHTLRILQAHCVVWWFYYVPRLTKSFGTWNQTIILRTCIERRHYETLGNQTFEIF